MFTIVLTLTAIAITLKFLTLQISMKCPWTGKEAHWFQKIFFGNLLWFGQYWNDFTVHGMENIASDNCLIVGYHSRCSLDLAYVASVLRPNIIASHILFAIPPFLYFLRALNINPSKGKLTSTTSSSFLRLIQQDRPLLLIPGGAYEFAKDYAHRYVVDWKAAPGFARALLDDANRSEQNTKVVPFHVRNCEEVYFTSQIWLDFTSKIVRRCLDNVRAGNLLYMPVLMFFGIAGFGFFIFPRSIPLHMHIGAPLTPKPQESPEQFGSRVRAALQDLIDTTQALPEPSPRPLSLPAALLKYAVFAPYLIFQGLILAFFMFSVALVCTLVICLFVIPYKFAAKYV